MRIVVVVVRIVVVRIWRLRIERDGKSSICHNLFVNVCQYIYIYMSLICCWNKSRYRLSVLVDYNYALNLLLY